MLAVGGAAAVIGLALLVADYLRTGVPAPDGMPAAQRTEVLAADGSPFGTLQGEVDRTDVPLAQVPAVVRSAVLAAEDRHFYHEPPIALAGVVRAALSDVTHVSLSQGGSTITQQYVKNAYTGSRRTLARKLQEAIMSIKLGHRYPKDKILELYLNTIYFGRGAYGIEAASETYFGVPVAQLDAGRGAVLAASIQAPEDLDPSTHVAAAQRRWRYVLDGMVSDHAIGRPEAAALSYPAVRPRGAGGSRGAGALRGASGYVLDMVRAELEAHGFTPRQVYAGGLRVTTTIEPRAQAAAVASVESTLHGPADPQAALVAVQPGTGRIVAVYGGHDFAVRQFNNATQASRQAGSSFKPYVLAAALTKGISLNSTFDGRSPQTFPWYGQPVSNFNNDQFGTIDLVTATANSVNTVYVPLAEAAGLDKVVGAAHAAGIPDHDPGNGLQSPVPLREDPSIALGTFNVHPIDQAAGFAAFAAGGTAVTPFLVDQVTDARGHRVYSSSVHTRQAFSPAVAADVTYALHQVVTRGTGAPEAGLAGGRAAAGKTGTTSNAKDAWFVGYTPTLATAVWMGYDPKAPSDKSVLTDVEGVPTVTGGTLPARIWKQFMDAALAGTPMATFPPPAFTGSPLQFATTTAPPTTATTPTAATTASTRPTTPPSLTQPTAPSTAAPPSTPEPTTASTQAPPTSEGPTTTGPGPPTTSSG